MINEWVEFCAYAGTVSYTASKKSDTTWLGRFTFATILEFEGMARILTVLARGYLFHSKAVDGGVLRNTIFCVDDLEHQPALRFAQHLTKCLMTFLNFLFLNLAFRLGIKAVV